MLRTERLCGVLITIGIFSEHREFKEQMSRASKASKHLLQHGMAGAKKDERKTDSKWYRLLSLRKGMKAKGQCNGGRSKVSPIKRNLRSERRRRTVSEIIINVLESDSDNDWSTKNCETELNSGVSIHNSNGRGSDGIENVTKRLGKAKSLDETANGSVQKTSRQSTFDEKITPIGRLLVPVRQEGESGGDVGYGFNSLFISPESPFEGKQAQNKPCSKWGFAKFNKWLAPAENAVNLKIFGGDRGLTKEKQRMMSFNFLIHPYSAFR